MRTEVSNIACDIGKSKGHPPYAKQIIVRDMRNDATVGHADIRIDGTDFRSKTFTEGTYQWRHGELPPKGTIQIACRSRHPFDFSPAILARLPYSLDGCTDSTVRIDLSRCVEPVERAHQVRLRGMYVSAFEESAFHPCDGLPAEASEFAGEPHNIWVGATRLGVSHWAIATIGGMFERRQHVHALYVDWSGTLHGPGNYGHLGLGFYEFNATKVHDTKIAKPDDCEAPGFSERMTPAR